MSVAPQERLTGEEFVRPNFEVIIGGAGQLATEEVVETPTYEYHVRRDEDDQVVGMYSRRTTDDGMIYKEFDAKGAPTYASETREGGDISIATWYKNGDPASRIEVNKSANTHTMTIFQPGIGDWVRTTQYEGEEGWVGSAPPSLVKKIR